MNIMMLFFIVTPNIIAQYQINIAFGKAVKCVYL